MNNGRTFIIKTLGCKANQYDSQLLREDLLARGFVERSGEANADVCIINTCTVTAESDAKSRQAIRALKRANPDSRIVVTGCYVQTNPEQVRAMPGVDAVVNNAAKETLADRVCLLLKLAEVFSKPPCSRITFFSGHTRAFVKIQDGCDENCSYCIVPFARGRSRSREIPDILAEVGNLVANGYREIVLTGIHIGGFGLDQGAHEKKLPDLIESLRGVEGLIRVRLSSIDPNEITDGLIQAMRNSPQVCRHLHVPLQSGSDAILRKMNRRYTRDSYLQTVALLRKELPGISITTDVMVGFPGETDDDFQQSRWVVCQAEFSKVHIFPFSSRPGAPARRFPNPVPPKVVRERIAQLAADAREAALKTRQRLLGEVVEVLVEREFAPTERKNLPPLMTNATRAFEGFSSDYLRTAFLSDAEDIQQLKNRIVEVLVEHFDQKYLYGRPV